MDIVDRLLSRIKVTPNGCFEWQGSRKGKTKESGYGRIQIDGKTHLAHRVSYQVFRGPTPPGMHVCHKCDNPCCINPSHLFLGTVQDNLRDAASKGRTDKRTGERNASCKLTTETILAIRESHAMGVSSYDIARKYSISHAHTRKIINRKRWAHV